MQCVRKNPNLCVNKNHRGFISLYFSALSRYLNLVHHVDMPPSQFRYCSLLVMFVFSSIQCSAYLIVAMTFERFYSIVQPHKTASLNTVKKARIIILCIFVFSFSYYIPLLFVGNNDGRNCIPNRFASGNVYGAMYYWISELIGFILPFVFLLTMNSVIIHTLIQRSKLNLMGTESQGNNQGQISKTKNSDKQVYSILVFVTFSYFLLTIPGKVLIFYLNLYRGYTAQYYAGLHLLDQVGGKHYYTNHGINFFLYVMSGQKFRTDLRNLFMSNKRATSSMSQLNTISSTHND